jgi:hypothetical protein
MDWTAVLTPVGVTAIVGAAATYFFTRLKDARDRIEGLENDLLKSREEAYGQIWHLTGALNLFGPARSVNCARLSGQLTDWYFSKGQMLTENSKSRYFLVQEVLNFYNLRRICPSRPIDELLYGGERRTIAVLRELRATGLAIRVKGDEATYRLAELETYVRNFKAACNRSPEAISQVDAWLLLQLVMSAFRSTVTAEIGSRVETRSSPPPRRKGNPR